MSRPFRLRFFLLLTAWFAVGPALDVLPVSQVKPGMKGVGKSVFSGTATQDFSVEVIDVMPKVWPRGDLILCRLSGQGLEESGVIAGMSGSPVYIEGKLVGAVAYAWAFAKEPIAGVTPIEQMLRIWKEKDRPESQGRITPGREGTGHLGLSPLPLPLSVSGLTPALSAVISPAFKEINLQPVAAAGRGYAADTSTLVPGGAVGVALTSGDVELSAIGTLTCREGDRILAFGHPMFQAGAVRMPMVGGVIHSVLPSVANSIKLFSPTSAVGVITQDRLAGIAGTIGPEAPMIPVTAALRSPSGLDTYRFRVLDQEDLAPLLVAAGLTDIVFQTEGTLDRVTLSSRLTVAFRPAGPSPGPSSLVVEHRFAGDNPAADLFRAAKNELEAIFSNRFLPAPVANVQLVLDFQPGTDLTYLLTAAAEQNSCLPGDTLRVKLGLRDYRGTDSDTTVAVVVPATMPAGTLRLLIAPRDSLLMMESARAPARLAPASFPSLLALFSETGRENELVVAGYVERPGLVLGDRELPSPPPSLRSVLLNPRSDELVTATSESPVFRQVLRFDRVVSGVARLDVEVRRQR
jgi:hypothetical protein